jgi:hypothetical protein
MQQRVVIWSEGTSKPKFRLQRWKGSRFIMIRSRDNDHQHHEEDYGRNSFYAGFPKSAAFSPDGKLIDGVY